VPIYWTGRTVQFLRTEVAPLENGNFYRVPTLVVLGMLVIISAWVEGCGGILGSGSGGSGTLTGTVIDSSTKNPVSGALVVLEQADASGIDRVVAHTMSASNGTFSFSPSAAGTYDVVADATVTTSGTTMTYAATVTFLVPATASLGQIPLVLEFGSAGSNRIPVTISNTVSSSRTAGTPDSVGVTLSALQDVSPSVGSVTQITIPVFAPSTPNVTTSTGSCPTSTDCATYSLLVPSGNLSSGIFSASGAQYILSTQQSPASFVIEGKAYLPSTPAFPTCTPSTMTSTVVITSGFPAPADIAFTGCS
jgi:Carboxypeptidase regulatory-like domain